jgi:hypothetical protein
VLCDVRQPGSAKEILITLVEHVLASGLSQNRESAANLGTAPA